jgi:hypothetical protein
MADIQRLIDNTLPFVQELLSKYGEFFPLASAVTISDNIAQVGTYDGVEQLESFKLIVDLKRALKAKQNDYKCIAIFYDVRVTVPTTKLKTDAIAVFVETESEETGFIIYYPYIVTDDRVVELTEGAWKEINDKEIFI